MKYQAIIPARGGSKRFKRKNLAILAGVPLIVHSIRHGLELKEKGLIGHITVNTDDDEIAEVAHKYGAEVMMRPAELGTDFTTTAEVLHHQVQEFDRQGVECDALLLLQATNPIRFPGMIEKAIEAFESSGRQSLTTFSTLNKKFGFIKNGEYIPDNYEPGQRMQDLEPRYFENGLLYITRRESLLKNVIITEDTFPLIVDDPGADVDIDLPEDMLLAEHIISTLK